MSAEIPYGRRGRNELLKGRGLRKAQGWLSFKQVSLGKQHPGVRRKGNLGMRKYSKELGRDKTMPISTHFCGEQGSSPALNSTSHTTETKLRAEQNMLPA